MENLVSFIYQLIDWFNTPDGRFVAGFILIMLIGALFWIFGLCIRKWLAPDHDYPFRRYDRYQ